MAWHRSESPAERRVAGCSGDRSGDSRPLAAARPSPFSPDQLLQRRLVQLRFGQQLLEPGVLLLELTQPLGVRDLHAAVLGLPAINRVLDNAIPARQLADRLAGLVLLEDRNNLLVRIPLPLHRGTSLGSTYKEIPHPKRLGLRGNGHFYHLQVLLPNDGRESLSS